jgi:signal transduction histidine kinase
LTAIPLRALVFTPNAADADLAVGFLAEYSIPAVAVGVLDELEGELPGDVGCLVFVEEALLGPDLAGLRALLQAQPAWSDLPLVLVTSHAAEMPELLEHSFPGAGNVTLLERPLNPLSLVSAVRMGLRARGRQLEVRELLRQREDAVRRRDDFLAMLAHELRNPLAPMRNAVWMQKRVGSQDPLLTKTREILERQVMHMSRLVDDLLDVARLERGKVKLALQPLNLNSAILAAIDACLPMINERSHTVETTLDNRPLYVQADPVRLEQLLSNVLVNACKYTPPGGRIQLTTYARGNTAIATIADNGIGLQPEQTESLFAPFVQGETSLARSGGGLGIGLSIARVIAEMHGGAINARSEGRDKGAVFELSLPLTEQPMADALGAAAQTPAAGPARRVLIIEDNDDIRESLSMVLMSWGHEVMLSSSGNEGLELALSAKPDVALIDIGLPGMNGYEVAQQLKEQTREWRNGIRLIAMTGYGAPADRARAADVGFAEHLIKPVDPEILKPLLAS